MSAARKKTVRLSVTFPRGRQSASALEELRREPELHMNVLRGRVSASQSSLELEVSGADGPLARAFERVARWGSTGSALTARVLEV